MTYRHATALEAVIGYLYLYHKSERLELLWQAMVRIERHSMTQFVYGKNVVAQLLDDGRKIHEVWLMQGFRDPESWCAACRRRGSR